MFEREEGKIVVRGTAAQQEGECAVNKTAEAFKGPHHLAHRPASATVQFGNMRQDCLYALCGLVKVAY